MSNEESSGGATRRVSVGGRTFDITPRSGRVWDIYERGEHFGWFAIGERVRNGWKIADGATYYQRPPSTVTALLVGRLWLDTFADNESPLS